MNMVSHSFALIRINQFIIFLLNPNKGGGGEGQKREGIRRMRISYQSNIILINQKLI